MEDLEDMIPQVFILPKKQEDESAHATRKRWFEYALKTFGYMNWYCNYYKEPFAYTEDEFKEFLRLFVKKGMLVLTEEEINKEYSHH